MNIFKKKPKPGQKGTFQDQGNIFRKIRKDCGLQQKEIAVILNKIPNDVSRYEHGYINIPGTVWMFMLKLRGKNGNEFLKSELKRCGLLQQYKKRNPGRL